MIKSREIIVIGGNAAGAAAAAKAKRINPEANVTIFEASEYISTGTCEIPYVLSGEIKDYKDLLIYDPATFRNEKGVNVFTKHRVDEINRKNKEIKVLDLYNGTIHFYKYDKVIIATGAKSKSLKQFSSPAVNLFELKNINDLLRIQEYLKKANRNVAVIGSGYIGLETADAFSKKGFEVIVIEQEKHPLSSAEPEIQLLVEELITKKNVRFFGGIKNLKPNYVDDKIESLNIEGRIVDVDLVILSVGFIPNSDLAKKAKLEIGEYDGIRVDAILKTSDAHIYAAGDCIEILNEITHRPFYLPIATLAHDHGHIAGGNAAGRNNRVNPAIRNISVKLWDKFYINVGLSTLEAKESKLKFKTVTETGRNLVSIMPGSEKVFGKIVYEEGSKRILGASFFGGMEVSGYGDLISALIKTKQPAGILTEINYNYTPPLSPQINLLSLLGRKIN